MTHTISDIIDLTNTPAPPRWFEFLLEPGKLQQHLETSGCDPSPCQLITLFFRNIPNLGGNNSQSPNQKVEPSPTINGNSVAATTDEPRVDSSGNMILDLNDPAEILIPPDSYEAIYRTKKAYSLQILAIKVASFLKWDLDLICNNLTIPVQYKLIQALLIACTSDECPTEVKKFADILYYHWFLRSAITYQLSSLQPQSTSTTIIYLSQLQQQQQAADSSALFNMGELFVPTSKLLRSSSDELSSYIWELTHNKDKSAKKIKGSSHPFKRAKLSRPKMECFDTRGEKFNDWKQCESIESKEFVDAACYDLGRFFFFEESYDKAKQTFELIKESAGKFSNLTEYLQSATDLHSLAESNDGTESKENSLKFDFAYQPEERRLTEKYLFDCMTRFSKSQKKEVEIDVEEGEIRDDYEEDVDLRLEKQQQSNHGSLENHAWYQKVPKLLQQQQMLEAAKGDVFMSQGNFKQAMGCFVGTLMLMTDYFRFFSKGYTDEEAYITRMIQCSTSLSCFTQAVALCQMTKNLNYTMAFKQLNERVCNDCCDDIYECIWNVTLLEYIINLHSKRGEVERRAKVIQLIGQLELNENNPEEILKEAIHMRRGRFFRIMSNKYL